MDRHSHNNEVYRLSVIETGLHLRYTDDEKLRIIAECERVRIPSDIARESEMISSTVPI